MWGNSERGQRGAQRTRPGSITSSPTGAARASCRKSETSPRTQHAAPRGRKALGAFACGAEGSGACARSRDAASTVRTVRVCRRCQHGQLNTASSTRPALQRARALAPRRAPRRVCEIRWRCRNGNVCRDIHTRPDAWARASPGSSGRAPPDGSARVSARRARRPGAPRFARSPAWLRAASLRRAPLRAQAPGRRREQLLTRYPPSCALTLVRRPSAFLLPSDFAFS